MAKYTFHKVCLSIGKLHALSIIHRDVKPENMFWSEDLRRIIMIDLGSAEDLENR